MRAKNVVEEGLEAVRNVFAGMLPDRAIGLLMHQHREVEELFEALERPRQKDVVLKKLVMSLAELLDLHELIEEKIFYPAAKAADPELVLESFFEHEDIENAMT